MLQLTNKAKLFKIANKKSLIISGAMLDKDKQDVQNPFTDHVYTRYQLENGQGFDLTLKDTKSLYDNGFLPNWKI